MLTLPKLLYWSPRILGLLYIGFISLFALDVFDGEYNFGQALVAFTMHLIPSMLVAIALAVAWRWEVAGALMFDALAIAYVISSQRLDWSLVIALPLFIISSLFVVGWVYRRRKSGEQ